MVKIELYIFLKIIIHYINYRDNGIDEATEADCYYVVKFFDSDGDGQLNF